MYQYWYYKKDNYDKIMCFKLGKFYELYDYDALICHKLLDLHFFNNSTLHVGFPEKALLKNCEKLVSNGFKVALIEPTETAR